MKTPVEFIRSVVGDCQVFLELYVCSERKVLRLTKGKENDFLVGFLIGWQLGRFYGQEENQSMGSTDSSIHTGESKD